MLAIGSQMLVEVLFKDNLEPPESDTVIMKKNDLPKAQKLLDDNKTEWPWSEATIEFIALAHHSRKKEVESIEDLQARNMLP